MTAILRQLAPTQVQLDIDVPADDLDKARARAVKRLSERLRIPGFRKGHIPRRIIEQHVGAEHIDHEAIEDVVPDVYSKALEEHDLDPVEQPKIDLERVDDGRALKITATVAVRPQITLAPYTDIEVTSPSMNVDEREVDESLEVLRKRAATLEPVADRGVQAGDVVTLDYTGRIDGETFEGGTATDHTTEISPQRFIPGFAEQLYGARAGERRTVTVTFPQEYKPDHLAGKTAVFDVLVRDVKQPVLAPLDDAFAKTVSDLETLAALRNEVRRRLERGAQARAREAVESALLRTLNQSNDFPLPDVLVDRETESILADTQHQVERAGGTWQEYLQERKLNEEQARANARADAERRVKSSLILEQIAKQEKIRVSGEDVDRELDSLARVRGATARATLDDLRSSGNIDRFLNAIRRNKTLGFLVEKAKVAEAPPAESPPPQVTS
ncbi:MAG: trigger factor [Candidatus Eremiobacteraeota bacterium]|nr:trigger factor [Candidatus Eremiobacteraeota bacterium]